MGDDPILACEAALRAAMLTNDVAALDRLIDDALVFTALDGTVVGKHDDLEAHRARRLRLTRMEPSDQRVLRLGAVAVVSVRMDHEGTWDGAPVGGALRYTRVWCERPEGWRIVAGHMSPVTG
jgi:ketosteroid isomerase-like protein